MGVTDRLPKDKIKRYHGGELAIALTLYASTLAGIVQADNEVGWHRWLETLLNAFYFNAEKARGWSKKKFGVNVCLPKNKR